MLKSPAKRIVDQYTDKSGAELVKIAANLADRKLASLALDTLFGMEREPRARAEFPSDTARDVFLSRIYFEGQREKIASDQAAEIDRRLSIDEELHGLPSRARFRPKHEKLAQVKAVALLPMCKIASKSELVQAGNDFCLEFEKLASRDRRKFARNFIKTARALGARIPDTVKLYAGLDVEQNPDLCENVLLRKLAMEGRTGADGGFGEIHRFLKESGADGLSARDLLKLACVLDEADNLLGLREHGHGRTIPDAWHSVFQVKKAEAAGLAPAKTENMTKADIISRYGEGVLEEVEDGEGEIDRQRLGEIVNALGDGHTESANDASSQS